MITIIEDIHKIALHGLRVHPLITKSKVPILKSWQQRASCSITDIDRWSNENPGCNWGVATGPDSGVFVVDVDTHNGGSESWETISSMHDRIITPTVITGTGGKHLYFTYPVNVEIRNKAGSVLGRGIDIRGIGGQVVIPPSTHPNGNVYRWANGLSLDDVPFMKAPKWLLRAITTSSPGEDNFPSIGENLEKGERNSTIFHNAFTLAKAGASREIVYTTMRAWCDQSNNLDISDSEIMTTVDSAFLRAEQERKKLSASKAVGGKTDDDNARRLASKFGDRIVYATGLGWFIWDGRHWEPDTENARVMMLAVQVMRELRDEALEEMKNADMQREALVKFQWATASLNFSRLSAMVNLASKYNAMRKSPMALDPEESKWLLNFMNGTLDLKQRVFREHRKEDMLTKLIRHNYNNKAVASMWERTMKLAFAGDVGKINFMQRALGYSITGSIAEQCLFIAWGESGNNGKSTILEGVQYVLGPGYSRMSDTKVITSTETDNRVASSLARLFGARFVSMNEAEEGQRLSETLIKQITGGDMIEACMKFKEPFEYQPQFKLWIRTNEKPIIRGTSDAIWRRIKIIPFIQPIPQEYRLSRDVVDQTIHAEAEGVLAWIVRGCYAWMDTGLQEPDEVRNVVIEYRSEMDVIESFMDEMVNHGDPAVTFCTRQELYSTFVSWCKMNGYKFIMTSDSFGKRVGKLLSHPKRESIDGQYVWRGIEISDSGRFAM